MSKNKTIGEQKIQFFRCKCLYSNENKLRRWLVFICVIGIFTLLCNTCTGEEQTISEWTHKGNMLNQNGQYQEAITAYDQAIVLDPNFIQAWVGKGDALLSLANYTGAIDAYNRSLELDPSETWGWIGKANALKYLGLEEEAITAFNNAIELNTSYSLPYQQKANALRYFKKFDDAITLEDKIISMDPNFKSAYVNKADILLNLEKYEDAIEVYNQVIDIYKDDIDSYIGKADALLTLKRYSEALDAYDVAIKLDPSAIWAWAGRGAALDRLNRYEEAVKSYDHVIALNETYAPAWSHKAAILQKLERPNEALEAYNQAIVNNPNSFGVWMAKGDLLFSLNKFPEAEEAYDNAIQTNQSESWAWNAKGIAQMNSGKYRESLSNFEQALKLNPNLTDAKKQIESAQFKIFQVQKNGTESLQSISNINDSRMETPSITETQLETISIPPKDWLSTLLSFFSRSKPETYSPKNFGITSFSDQIIQISPVDVLLQNDTLLIADANNHSVIRSDYSGNVTLIIGGSSNPGLFQEVTCITTDSYGNIYVLDAAAEKVYKFDNTGNILISWGSNGTEPGQFSRPSRIANTILVNTKKEIISVVDTGNKRIQFFDCYGEYISSLSTLYGLKNGVSANRDMDPNYIADEEGKYINISREEADPPFAYRTFTINILDVTGTLEQTIDRGLYLGAQKRKVIDVDVNSKNPEQWNNILTGALQDPVTIACIDNISVNLWNISSDNKLTDSESLDLTCTFIQQLPLVNETDHRYPIEVLHDKKATSFDKTLFLYGLLYHSGYDVVFLSFPGSNHCAVAVRMDKSIAKPAMKEYEIGNKSYVYINPDKPDLIGRMDPALNGMDPTIIHLLPQDENHIRSIPDIEKRLIILETLDAIKSKKDFLSANKDKYSTTEREMANTDISKIKSVIDFVESNTWNTEGISMRLKNSKVGDIQINYKKMSSVESII